MILLYYDSANKEHNDILNEFNNNSKSEYIHSISDRLKLCQNPRNFLFNTGYLIEIDNNIVGYLFISRCVSDEISLENSLLKEYRGKKYGKLILSEVSNYLFENYNIKTISLDIDPSNIASIRTALSCGYIPGEDEYLSRNMNGKILYHLDNYNYINKRRK